MTEQPPERYAPGEVESDGLYLMPVMNASGFITELRMMPLHPQSVLDSQPRPKRPRSAAVNLPQGKAAKMKGKTKRSK